MSNLVSQIIDKGIRVIPTVISAATTLTLDQSGMIFLVDLPALLANAYNITLPATATAAGVEYTFIVRTANGAAGGNATIVSATGTDIQGILTLNAVPANIASRTSIAFVLSVATPGTYVNMVCSGASWSATAVSKTAAAIALA